MIKNIKTNNHENLSDKEIINETKKELEQLQKHFLEKKITTNDTKTELQKINKLIQWTKLEQQHKQEIWEIFDQLINKLEENIDENYLQVKFNEVINLLERLIQKDLATLKRNIQQMNFKWNSNRPNEVQQWIYLASNNLETTINDGLNDENFIANKAAKRMKKLIT